MGQNTRQLLQLILIVVAFTAGVVWLAPLQLNAVVWLIRILSPIASVGMAYVVFKVTRSPGKFPDHLRAIFKKYFEREGFCFAPVVEVQDGASVLCIYFQNRYARDLVATVAMQPAAGSFRFSRPPLPSASVQVHCPGVAFGVARIPYAVPQDYRARRLAFEIAADVRYPNWCGPMVRMHGGMRCGCIANLSQGTRLLRALGGLAFGIIHEEHPARTFLTVPHGVSDGPGTAQQIEVAILWQPPTEGIATSDAPRRAAA